MRLLAVSPHLDDAAFSAGGTLALRARHGWDVTIATCFTGNVAHPEGFALACQLDKGLPADIDYMALRRREDKVACAVLAARPVHMPFLEAPHRGYNSAPALFAERRDDDDIVDTLVPALADLIRTIAPDLVLAPLCLGDHVDHHVVRDALIATGVRPLYWEDWPYADRPDVARPTGAALVEPLDDWAREQRTKACAAYASQLGFQFGGADAMAARVARIDAERFHAARVSARAPGERDGQSQAEPGDPVPSPFPHQSGDKPAQAKHGNDERPEKDGGGAAPPRFHAGAPAGSW